MSQPARPSHEPHELPPDLPVPIDDGAALHLRGSVLPDVALRCTDGREMSLIPELSKMVATKAFEACKAPQSSVASTSSACALTGQEPGIIIFTYPRTGIPGQPPSLGFAGEEWESIPGARGCTPQSCGFRDAYTNLQALHVDVLGLSTNTSEHQREFKRRNRVPFEFLSDADLALTRAMNLPTFDFPVESGGPTTLIKRMAWYIALDAVGTPRVVKAWYPVFPPDQNAATVLAWLQRRRRITIRPTGPRDEAYVRAQVAEHWGEGELHSLGRWFDPSSLPGFIAEIDGQPAGHISLQHDERETEVVTLSASSASAGVGSMLLDVAEDLARAHGHQRIYLTATNDAMQTLQFYQRRGWRISGVNVGGMDAARAKKPSIPRMGLHGVPLRDEIIFEYRL